MEQTPAPKAPKGRPYYKIIDGQRYDLALLQQVDTYISTSSGNALSEAEVKAIAEAIHDSNRVTKIEKNTLEYIRSNYPFSTKAAKWWDDNLKIGENLQQRIFDLKSRHQVPGLQIIFDQGDLIRQTNIPSNKMGFEEALADALKCLLTDSEHTETPLNIVTEVFTDASPKAADYAQKLEAEIQRYFNTGRLGLLPDYDVDNPDSWENLPYNIPENRETVADNWIFVLALPDLSDHIYWAIIDRTGEKAAYCYGFN
ncbi:MAG: hypothetical protein KGS48_03845 [Bacteroidetes bacterium]|nr:hypothetical protein [Bacteroidota bacterium]